MYPAGLAETVHGWVKVGRILRDVFSTNGMDLATGVEQGLEVISTSSRNGGIEASLIPLDEPRDG